MKTQQGRVAIVTGASAGIGLAIGSRLARSGFGVVLNARRRERLDELCAGLNQDCGGARVVGVAGDCAEQGVIEAMFEGAARAFGRAADTVVVNAGRGLAGSVLTSDPSQWEEMIRTNLLGAARLIREAGARMLKAADADPKSWLEARRDIVVIGSIVGRHVSPFSSMYGGTKFGLHGLTEGVRRELAPKGVRVTLVEPGFVASEFQGVAGYKDEWFQGVLERLGPVLEPDDVARAVEYVLEQRSHVHMSDLILRPTRQDYP